MESTVVEKAKLACVLSIGLLAQVGCAGVRAEPPWRDAERTWREACRENTVSAYRRYLQSFPRSEFSSAAVDRIQSVRHIRTVLILESVEQSSDVDTSYVDIAEQTLRAAGLEVCSAPQDADATLLITVGGGTFFETYADERGRSDLPWPHIGFYSEYGFQVRGNVVLESREYPGLGPVYFSAVEYPPDRVSFTSLGDYLKRQGTRKQARRSKAVLASKAEFRSAMWRLLAEIVGREEDASLPSPALNNQTDIGSLSK